MTSIYNGTAALKVFGIPELAHLICGTSRKHDNVNLMRVCRQLFHDILPFVWEEVDNVVPLVSMIPGGAIINYESEPFPPFVVLQCPGSLNLSRLNIYAPYVKQLVIPSRLEVDEQENLDKFVTCSRSANQGLGLLPNLCSIRLSLPTDNPNWGYVVKIGAESISWIIAFLSPSVRKIDLTTLEVTSKFHSSAWVDSMFYHELMTHVSQTCPNLCSLDVLPGYLYQITFRNFTFVKRYSFANDIPGIHQPLLGLNKLASLVVSPLFLSKELLHVIAAFPALESLCICGLEVDDQDYCKDLYLPVESFPALRHLELNRLTWGTMINICNLKPIVDGLQALYISYPNEARSVFELEIPNQHQPTIAHIVFALVKHNAKLTTLDVRLRDPPPKIAVVAEQWKQLPLSSLRLGWREWTLGGFETLYRLLLSLPLLEDLVFDEDSDAFTLGDLRKVVQLLPYLCHIQLPIAYRSLLTLIEEDFQPSDSLSERALCIESHFALLEPKQTHANLYAMFLAALRPMSRIVCKTAKRWREPINEGPTNMINDALVEHYRGYYSSSSAQVDPREP